MSITLASSILGKILIALLLTLVSGLVSIKIAHRFGLIDVPGSAPHKKHHAPTPLAGGLAMGLAFAILTIAFGLWHTPELRAILTGGLVVFIFGLLDDYRGISPLPKFLGQTLAAVVLIGMGVSVGIFQSPGFFFFGETRFFLLLNWLITVFWVVGITNAFNFVDSMDGLAVALAGIASAFFVLVTIDSNQPMLTGLFSLLLGTCIGLYFFNAPPAWLFLGDSGAQMLGFILASLAIVYTPDVPFQTSSWFVPIMILGIPIFDATLVVFSRIRHGRPIYQSGVDHTYHRLVRRGFEPNRAVLTMHIGAMTLGCLAIIALYQPPVFSNSIFGFVLFLGAGAVLYFDETFQK